MLQRLKRSLSFKTKSLRSKSADNFFQRPIEDVKFQTDLLSDVSSSTGHLSIIGVSVSASPAMSLPPPPPPLPTIIPGNLPITICSPSRAPRPADPNAHTFLEHIFKKPHFCDVCNHMIVACQGGAGKVFGTNAKLGLRCKACKMGIHNKCLDRVGQQRCMGKLPKGFRRYSSSPLLIQEQFGCIREVMPIACGSKVDPVYETLRFGTSLAQKTKRTSGSESPQRNSSSDVVQVPEEKAAHSSRAQLTRKPSDNVFTPLENGTEHFHIVERKSEESPKINYVCYKFIEAFRKICLQRAVRYRDIILHKLFPAAAESSPYEAIHEMLQAVTSHDNEDDCNPSKVSLKN
ncbi:SH3 and cysteine-rich domain-containing protein-like [Sinocyclocheilus grahami]|uniref:SH3 and cysteine-rich domain-containing protein-like n=1 Tax=Sinocyclocheilus grahami TaxID=75366 RepID=UPI0007AD1E03|nr:PREDICTED: SH3 and cysteine-rich domain-containing protein-like [Sinocyclocheilus grahami]